MQIELFPLEKMVIDGKDINLGCDRQTATALLGNAEAVDDNEEDFYSFRGISVGVWAENDDDDYWMTIGIGIKEYY